MKLTSRTLAGGAWVWVSLALLGLLGAQSYLSYKFPIKQDLYGHPFRTHPGDRILAYAYLLRSDRRFSHFDVAQIDAIIEDEARANGVDPSLVKAITAYESSYVFSAISTTGAMGLMALMPGTLRELGVRDPFDPKENVAAGVRQVKKLSDAFQGDPALILAGYNAGPSSVRKYGGVPPFAETTAYVANVLRLRDLFEGETRAANVPCPRGR